MAHIKQTSTYKMSKALKTSLALSSFKTDDQRHQWRRAMIQAELASQIKPVREKGKRPMGATGAPSAE